MVEENNSEWVDSNQASNLFLSGIRFFINMVNEEGLEKSNLNSWKSSLCNIDMKNVSPYVL